eukprot:980209-Rhodomonas_salina.1
MRRNIRHVYSTHRQIKCAHEMLSQWRTLPNECVQRWGVPPHSSADKLGRFPFLSLNNCWLHVTFTCGHLTSVPCSPSVPDIAHTHRQTAPSNMPSHSYTDLSEMDHQLINLPSLLAAYTVSVPDIA